MKVPVFTTHGARSGNTPMIRLLLISFVLACLVAVELFSRQWEGLSQGTTFA